VPDESDEAEDRRTQHGGGERQSAIGDAESRAHRAERPAKEIGVEIPPVVPEELGRTH
jgi:hypothetical protein